MALNGERTCNMLHSEIIADCSRTVTNEIACLNKSTPRKEVMEKIVQSSLSEGNEHQGALIEGYS